MPVLLCSAKTGTGLDDWLALLRHRAGQPRPTVS
jgi:hypothetical protein